MEYLTEPILYNHLALKSMRMHFYIVCQASRAGEPVLGGHNFNLLGIFVLKSDLKVPFFLNHQNSSICKSVPFAIYVLPIMMANCALDNKLQPVLSSHC